ncbi:hypothetical protein BKA62DRAFT_777811 [Auriculariales sp. MPI-PUGE-AT-0066]|nr:hypothetical protein BKA62DRAFT_777811 [Auriculariales sp. MPI-PUGE-AT-0066]
MSTAAKKVIVVFGATGNAGGSVAKYLLEDGRSQCAPSRAMPTAPGSRAQVKVPLLSRPTSAMLRRSPRPSKGLTALQA